MTVPFKPSGHWVVVARDPDQTETKGGLAIAQKYQLKMSRGTVLALGWGIKGKETNELVTINENIKVGSVVQWQAPDESLPPQQRSPRMDHDIEVQGKIYTLVPAGSIVLVEDPVLSMTDRELEDKLREMESLG